MPKAKAKQLLDAHVKYELALFTGEALTETLHTEVEALYDWLEDVTLEDLSSVDEVVRIIKTHIFSRPIPDDLLEFVKETGGQIYAYMKENKVKGSDFISKKLFDQLTEQTDAKRRVRQQALKKILNMSLYGKLLSEVLFHSIKDFMTTENPIAKKIPGASKFFKMGQDFVSHNFGGLEAGVEKNIKSFLEKQINVSVKQSEEFLNKGLDSDLYQTLLEEVWEIISEQELYKGMDIVGKESIEELEPLIKQVWEHLRRTSVLVDLVKVGVEAFFERYGSKELKTLFVENGWDKAKFSEEATRGLKPVFEKAVASGLIQKRLQAHLKKFYQSEELLNILQT